MKINYNKSISGFTLVELMVAITVLALVTLIIGNGFRLGMDAWGKGERETSLTQRFRVLSGMLSQQIKSSYPYEIDVEDEKAVLFQGDEDSILFATAIADKPYGGFRWVRYSTEEGVLFMKEGFLPDKEFEEKTKGKEEIVDSDVVEFKLEYYSLDDEEWKESWDYGENLPGAVKVKISYFEPFLIHIPMGLASDNKEKE